MSESWPNVATPNANNDLQSNRQQNPEIPMDGEAPMDARLIVDRRIIAPGVPEGGSTRFPIATEHRRQTQELSPKAWLTIQGREYNVRKTKP